ncbi:MAG: glycosyltransferase, partial [Planctomycetota bacterium]
AEIVPDGRCGFLVPRRDAEALAKRIIDLFCDPQTQRRFRENARAHFDAHFTVDRCAAATADFFDEIIMARRRATIY